MWDPGCILIVLFFCHVYDCYSNKSVNKRKTFVTLRWFIWSKCTFWRCDMLISSPPRQLLRPSASCKHGRTFPRWARWRHTGSGQRDAWVWAEALDRCSGKHGHRVRQSEYQDTGGEMCTYGEQLVCVRVCSYGQRVPFSDRSFPSFPPPPLPPAGLWLTAGPRDHNVVSFLKSASGSCTSAPLITRFYPWRRRAVKRSQRLAGDESFDAFQRVASSLFASVPHTGPFVFKICSVV